MNNLPDGVTNKMIDKSANSSPEFDFEFRIDERTEYPEKNELEIFIEYIPTCDHIREIIDFNNSSVEDELNLQSILRLPLNEWKDKPEIEILNYIENNLL